MSFQTSCGLICMERPKPLTLREIIAVAVMQSGLTPGSHKSLHISRDTRHTVCRPGANLAFTAHSS